MRELIAFLPFIAALVLSPLLLGLINRTKAILAGRRGQPLLQVYFDTWKLLQKGAVYSTTATWLLRAGPTVSLAAIVGAALLVPAGALGAALPFTGDFVLAVALLGLARLAMLLAALDSGSAFAGMGASREAQFAALAEPALLLSLAALSRQVRSARLSDIIRQIETIDWQRGFPALCLVAAALAIVVVTENSRVPVDDPDTHLELTMIHEAMVLDHSGPDLAYIHYGAALKLWVLGSLLVGVAVPVRTGTLWLDGAAFLGGMAALAIGIGLVESIMARFSLLRVPKFLGSAAVLAALACLLVPR
jgi:formate hydrogenlyase subunit 4